MLEGKNVLVTGGAGFIGSNIVDMLVEKNNVSVIDNMHTGSEENIKKHIDSGKVKLFKLDVMDIEKTDLKPDVIIHLGMPSSSPMYKDNNYLVSSAIEGAISLYKFAVKNNSKIVFASSSSIYNGNKPPYNESMPLKVTDFYTEARIAIERLGELYNNLYGITVIGLRLFSIYGPNEESKKQYANLISQFIWAIKKGEKPLIYGDGEQTRDFTYVEDVANAFIKATELKGFDVFNVGTGKSYSLNQLMDVLSNHIGKKITADYIKQPIKNYVMQTNSDTSKAEKVMGFKAQYSLDDGVSRLVKKYF